MTLARMPIVSIVTLSIESFIELVSALIDFRLSLSCDCNLPLLGPPYTSA